MTGLGKLKPNSGPALDSRRMISSRPRRFAQPVPFVRLPPCSALPLLLSLVTTSLAALGAAEPSPFAAPTSDVMLTLKVTAALQADALKDLPLTVDVARGVATVGGEVPDAARLADVPRGRIRGRGV